MINIQNRIMTLVNSGQLQSARQECLNACNDNVGSAELWFMLSAICGQMQDFPAAELYCKKALKINSSVPSAYYNLAVALRGQGKTEEAYLSLEKAVELQADFIAARYEMGNICLERQNYSRAIGLYNEVLKTAPDAFQVYAGLAAAQEQLGEFELAISACLESLRINAAQKNVAITLGRLYDRLDKVEEAVQYYNRAIELGYNAADVFINLGRMLALQGKFTEAESQYKRAIAVDSASVEALSNLALLYEDMQDFDNALECIESACRFDDNDERLAYNHAKILVSLRQYSDAEAIYKKILEKNPDFSEAAVNLGNLYLLAGKANEAQGLYEHACASRPDFHDACSNMLMSLNYTNNHSNEEIRDKHFSWARKKEKNIKRLEARSHIDQDMGALKVGYVSPDFRNHSVAYFFEGILKNSDNLKIVNYCYSDVKNKDDVTQRLENYSDHWRDVSNLDNKSLAQLIQRDAIDILIDLCGHVSGNRLPAFALKPAPVQITYLGYPNTTGLNAMDFRIIDKSTDPEGAEVMMSEVPLYIAPCFLNYTPYQDSPDVAELPALRNGFITFGSFNNLAKMTDEVVDTWSKILSEVPGSRLCIKARQYADATIKQDHIKRFNNAGIKESRLDFITYSNTTAEHLAMYNNIDIALDTFPYNGTTTTFEAMWMGVPVVCISGTRHASRVGASIMKVLELDDLVAENQENYVKIAHNLAQDTKMLAEIRGDLRMRMLHSPLLDSETFTRKFESILLSVRKKS